MLDLSRFVPHLSTAAMLVAANVSFGQQDPPQYMGKAYVFKADIEHARSVGWIPADADEEEVLDAIEKTLDRRLRSMGMFPEARAEREDDHHFAVTFVGRMDQAIETFLVGGLSNPGRISLRVLASDGDLAAERERLQRWRAENEARPVEAFNLVPRESGGPSPAIDWLEWFDQGGAEDAVRVAPPIEALMRNEEHLLGHDRVARLGYGLQGEAPEEIKPGLRLSIREDHVDALEAFVHRHGGKTLAFVVNDRIMHTMPAESFGDVLAIPAGVNREQHRQLLLAFAGGPLEAPLHFVEFGKRPLRGVKTRPDGAPKDPSEAPEQKPKKP